MMKKSNLLFLPLMAIASSALAADAPSNAANLPPLFNPLVILAPTEMRTEPALVRGCWARLFPVPDFKGQDDLTIAGPMEIPALHTPIGAGWKQRTRSILVGPKATVTVFEGEKFTTKEATFTPGSRITDLRKALPNVMAINSLRITCEK